MEKRRRKDQGESPADDAISTPETIELDAVTLDDDAAETGTAWSPRRLAMLLGGRRPGAKLIGAVAGIAALAVLAIAGYFAWTTFGATFGARIAKLEAGPRADDIAGAVDDLAARLDAFDKRLSAIENAPLVAIDVDDIDERLADIELRLAEVTADDGGTADLAARIEAIERDGGRDATGPLQADIERLAAVAAGLEDRIAAIESRPAAPATPVAAQPAMLLAVGQLRTALRASGPFEAALEAVAAIAGDDAGLAEALAPLAARAATGVATVAALRADFADVALDVARTTDGPGGRSWVDRTIDRLAQLVTVRRVGDVAGDTAEAIVARAEQRLAAGDLAAAVGEVQRLEGPAAEAAAAWLADARARLTAERALAVLDARAVAAMAGGGG